MFDRKITVGMGVCPVSLIWEMDERHLDYYVTFGD